MDRLLFHFAWLTQWTTIVNNRFRPSHTVYNICGLTRSRTGDRINSCTYFVFKTRIYPTAASGAGSECGSRISSANFLIVFHSNYGSILLSFRDTTTNETDNGRRMTDDGSHCISGSGRASRNRWNIGNYVTYGE